MAIRFFGILSFFVVISGIAYSIALDEADYNELPLSRIRFQMGQLYSRDLWRNRGNTGFNRHVFPDPYVSEVHKHVERLNKEQEIFSNHINKIMNGFNTGSQSPKSEDISTINNNNSVLELKSTIKQYESSGTNEDELKIFRNSFDKTNTLPSETSTVSNSVYITSNAENEIRENLTISEISPDDFKSSDSTAIEKSTEDPNTVLTEIPLSDKSSVLPTTGSPNLDLNQTTNLTEKEITETSIADTESSQSTEDNFSTNMQSSSFVSYSPSSIEPPTDNDQLISNSSSNFVVDGNNRTSSITELEAHSETRNTKPADLERSSSISTTDTSSPKISLTTIIVTTKQSSKAVSSKDENVGIKGSTGASETYPDHPTKGITTDYGSSKSYTSPKTVKDQTSEGRVSSNDKVSIPPKSEEVLAIITQPQHVIEISSIRTVKTVVSVVFLAIALVATAVLTIYVIKIRRREVEYDQLTLLP